MRSAALKSASAICAPIGGACLEPCASGPEPAAEARPEPPADSGSVSAQELPSPTGVGTASEGERSPREAASRQAVPAAAAIPALAAKPEYKPPVTGSDWGTSAAGMRHCAAARPSEPVSCAASDFELAWSLMPRSNKRAAAERASEAVRSAAAWEGARGLTGGTSADQAPKRPRAPRPPRPPAAAVAEPALGGGLVDAGAPGVDGDGVQPAPPKRGRGRPKGSGKQRGAQQRTTTLAAARLASAAAVAAAAVVVTTATGGAAAATEAAAGSTNENSAAPPARGGNRRATTHARGSAASGAGKGSGRRARTELSAAGLANRLLALGQDPYFRCEVSGLPEDGGLIVQWAFPGGTAGDCNAWVGLHEAAGVNWAASAQRPPYARFKQINENRPVGEKRFTPKELAQLPDGLYFASLHAGDFATVHSAGGYAVSQRVRLVGGRAVTLIGLAHAALVPAFKQPPSARASGPARAEQRNGESLETTITLGAGAGMRVSLFYGEGLAGACARDDDDDDDDVGAMPARLALAVPVVHLDLPPGFESAHVKKVYKTVDALSFLDWGLCSDDAVAACRRKAASRAEARLDGGERVHGETQAAREGTVREEALTTRTSEHYGEATLATVERMLHTLEHLNEIVPAMSGWGRMWNLTSDSTFLDIGSGYGKVVFHTKLKTRCRRAVGIECVTARHLIAAQALDQLDEQLTEQERVADTLSGVELQDGDATLHPAHDFSHVYVFDRVFSVVTLTALAAVLERSSWLVLVSSKPPKLWWECGLRKALPIARLRFVTTGKERCTCYVYANAEYAPQQAQA